MGNCFGKKRYHPVASEEVTVHTHHQPFREKIIESIREVEVIEETDFVVSTRGGSFEWKGYGLRLSISEDSLPSGIEECRINIKASLSGPFQLPEDSDLLSPVFWISALCKFEKLVTLEIQHCASRDEASFADLNFISTKCSQRKLPYIFKQLDGGRFPADSSYGGIQLSHFSGIGIAGKKGTPQAYCAQIYYTIKKEPFDWRFYLFITKDLDTLKTIVGKHYSQETSFQVRFGRSKISLDIPEDGKLTKEGWRLTPSTHPTIYRKDVDDFVPGLCIPPKCELLVEWDPKSKDKKPVHLRHKINLIGASKPFNFFNLSLNPTEPEVVEPQSTTSAANEQSPDPKNVICRGDKPNMRNLLKFPGKHGRINIPEQIGKEYTTFGTFLLKDDSGTIVSGIESAKTQNATEINRTILREWINGKGQEPFTWATLVKCLRDAELNGLADDIEVVLIYDSSHIS